MSCTLPVCILLNHAKTTEPIGIKFGTGIADVLEQHQELFFIFQISFPNMRGEGVEFSSSWISKKFDIWGFFK